MEGLPCAIIAGEVLRSKMVNMTMYPVLVEFREEGEK